MFSASGVPCHKRGRSSSPSLTGLEYSSTPPEKKLKLTTGVTAAMDSSDAMLPIDQPPTCLPLLSSKPSLLESDSNSRTQGLALLDDDFHMNRIKRLATWFGIYDWIFKDDGKLGVWKGDLEQCARGTRTQFVADIISWIENPHLTGHVLEIAGEDGLYVIGSVVDLVKDSNPVSFLSLPRKETWKVYATSRRIAAFITLGIATQEEELAEFIESCISLLEPETLSDTEFLFSLLFKGLDTPACARKPRVVMLNTDILGFAPEFFRFIMETPVGHPTPILWLLRSLSKPLPPSYHGLLISKSVPPLTCEEKKILLLNMQNPYTHEVERWCGGEQLLIPLHVIESCLFYRDESDPNSWGMDRPSECCWSLFVTPMIDAAIGFLRCFRSLGLSLNQDHKQHADDICCVEHPLQGQYRPLIALADDNSIGTEQFALIMVLVVVRLEAKWAECTYSFFLNAFNCFRDGTLDFIDLVESDTFCSLFEGYDPNEGLDMFWRASKVVDYLEDRFCYLIEPISDLALVPPFIFACLFALRSRPIDRVLYAKRGFNLEEMCFRSSIVYLHRSIHLGLWTTLSTVSFWDDPDFLAHLGSVLPLMRFHTHSIPVNEFLWFVSCMRYAGMRAEFLRVQPLSPLDRDLINACGSLVRPLDFETELPAELTNLSNHGEAGYILLGFPTDPVLCIIVEEAITLYTHADLEELL